MWLYSQNFYQNQGVLRRSIYIEPVLTSREECNEFADLFFRIYLCLLRDFVNQHVFLLLDLHWDSPKLPWGMQRFFGPFVLKTIIMTFKRFFVLWLSLIRSLYVIQVYMKFCILLLHSAPFFLFSYILLNTNFFLCILPREIFFLFLMTLLPGILLFLISAVKDLIWTRFFFLTFIVLIRWDFPWTISINLLIFTNKASGHVVIA